MNTKKPTLILKWLPLFVISSLSLFVELAVIRWLSGEVSLFSYFKNLPLLAAFLGLSIGFALVGKGRDYQRAFIPLLGMFVAVVIITNRVTGTHRFAYPGGGDEFLWETATLPQWAALIFFLGVVILFFLLVMLLFIPLGQAVGEEMAIHAPVPAYIVNILASLAGVWAFSFLSYLQTPPWLWFGLVILGVGWYTFYRKKLNRPIIVVSIIILAGIAVFQDKAIWSPYNHLSVEETTLSRQNSNDPIKVGYTINVQQTFYQFAYDFSTPMIDLVKREVPGEEGLKYIEIARSYNLPYLLVPAGSRVLVVGSGLGSDIAAALRYGMGSVDGVEIDPTILKLGRELHPEKPYSDPRVNAIVDDARSFFNKNINLYDIVVFGLLDSHTLLSSMSSVRLDSFVYTIESFTQAKKHLKDNGVMAVTFAAQEPWLKERLGRMMVQVYGADKVYSSSVPWVGGETFVAGSFTQEQLSSAQLSLWKSDPVYDKLPIPTDDWPYLYMRLQKIPAAYWQVLLLIGIVCVALIARVFPQALRPDWHFWLLGAAFLLIEFKSITELALLFGTTWLVNSFAISGVLLMSLLANLYVLWRKRVDLRLAYVLLFASLFLTFLFPLNLLGELSPFVRAIVSMVLLSLPLLFAGLIFSESLSRAGETAWPLASNFSGSVVGGMLEYVSLWWGIKSLYIVGILIYGAAMGVSLFRKK